MQKINLNIKHPNILIIGPILLSCIILFYHIGFVYDEPWYYENLISLNKLGLNYNFLLHLKGPPGPLHAIIYYPLFKIFSSEYAFIYRIFSLMLSIISLYIVSRTKINSRNIGSDVFLIFACPVFYVVSGLALTEVPAMLFLAASLFILSKIDVEKMQIWLLLLSALFLSISVCGRQPSIMLVPAVFCSYIYINKWNTIQRYKKALSIVFFCMASLLLPGILFYIWHGIVPKIGGQDATRESYNLINGLLGLGYLVIFIFFLFPNIVFTEIKQKYLLLLGCFVFVSLANILIFKQEFYFINSVAERYLSPYLLKTYGLLGFSLLICLSILSFFLFNNLFMISRNDFFKLSCLFGLYFITLTCLKVTHQFSSRYVYQGLFLIFPILSGIYKPTKFTLFINSLGLVLGLLSFLSYLQL